MPKLSLHMLTWSQEQQRYELSLHGHLSSLFIQTPHSNGRVGSLSRPPSRFMGGKGR